MRGGEKEMGELLKEAELLNQSPSLSSVFGLLVKIAKAIEDLQPKKKCVEAPAKKGKKKK
jgi:hypothetical protein